jgi:hypothetical protein
MNLDFPQSQMFDIETFFVLYERVTQETEAHELAILKKRMRILLADWAREGDSEVNLHTHAI